MHLAIDLRFYRPEPYGLAVHIRDLFAELIPLLVASSRFTKVTLIMDKRLKGQDLSGSLNWWEIVRTNSKFQVHFSGSRYYSVPEQTIFLAELLKLNPDLTFFFNFNFPILYPKRFVYQVLDLTIPKTKPKSLKLTLAKLIIQAGLRKAKHIFFLGQQTKQDATQFSGLNFQSDSEENYKPNTVLYNGINQKYLQQPSASVMRSEQLGLVFSQTQVSKLNELQKQLGIKKEYFLFVSVWRKYKNVERLVEAFEEFNRVKKGKYQLVLAGRTDEKYPEVLARVKASPEFEKGNILVPGALEDESLILLQDGAKAYVFPSASEGFGLTLIEAAARGTPVLCSDIPVFREILPDSASIFFDPQEVGSIVAGLSEIVEINPKVLAKMVQSGHKSGKQYTWLKTAKQILLVLESLE